MFGEWLGGCFLRVFRWSRAFVAGYVPPTGGEVRALSSVKQDVAGEMVITGPVQIWMTVGAGCPGRWSWLWGTGRRGVCSGRHCPWSSGWAGQSLRHGPELLPPAADTADPVHTGAWVAQARSASGAGREQPSRNRTGLGLLWEAPREPRLHQQRLNRVAFNQQRGGEKSIRGGGSSAEGSGSLGLGRDCVVSPGGDGFNVCAGRERSAAGTPDPLSPPGRRESSSSWRGPWAREAVLPPLELELAVGACTSVYTCVNLHVC